MIRPGLRKVVTNHPVRFCPGFPETFREVVLEHINEVIKIKNNKLYYNVYIDDRLLITVTCPAGNELTNFYTSEIN